MKQAAAAARKNPVDAWPGSIMFFFRTTGLLRGLCSALDVEQPYLAIMAEAAARALRARYPQKPPPPLLHPAGPEEVREAPSRPRSWANFSLF